MKRTPALILAATAVTATTVVGAGTFAYAQTTGTAPPSTAEGHKPRGPHADMLGAAAKALGMSTDDLKTALEGGKTIAQVAQDKGVDVNTVIAAVTDAVNASIDQAVTDGKLTADQATQEKQEATERVTEFVNNTRPPKGQRGPGGPEGRRGPRTDVLAAAAGALNMSADDLKSATQGGKTIAQVAQEKGVDVNTVIAAVADAIAKDIDAAVANGTMTTDKAAEEKAEATEHATKMVNEGPRGERGPGGRGGPGARFGDPIATAATALNMSEADLKTALDGGKTIAQVAQDKGVDPNTVIAALNDAANKAIDQAVADGRLTADQAAQAKTKAAEHAAKIVNNLPRHGR